MVYYISSPNYQPMINKILTETDQVCSGKMVGEQQFFKKFVKENITIFEHVEILILDLTALADTDEEIMQGIDSIKIMDYQIRFVILAPYRNEGDRLLKKCFYAGIYDLIVTDEYLELSQQLTHCITEGMRYKDALMFRDLAEAAEPKGESLAVQKIIVGVAGAGVRAGCTHGSIIIANYLRKQNQMTAVMEMNPKKAFQTFCEAQKAKIFNEGYFSINGVDFYSECDKERVISVSGKLYNFIVLDFGNYYEADKVLFNRSDVRIIYSGTKPWELGNLKQLFEDQEEEVLKKYHFCFLGTTSNKLQKDIIEHMQPLENIWFPEYQEDPFTSCPFPEGQNIFADYIKPVEVMSTKSKPKFLFGRK